MKTIAYIVDPVLGHVARAHEIAKHIQTNCDVRTVFITPDEKKYVQKFLGKDFEVLHLAMDQDQDPLQSVRFASVLEPALDRLKPDLIVHDLCPLRYLSASRFPDCPRVHVTNAFLTGPSQKDTFQTRWLERIGPSLNKVRDMKGLAPLESAFHMYEADQVLCADPKFVSDSLPNLPSHYTVCGHVKFKVDAEIPNTLVDTDDFMILSMGTSGPTEFSLGVLEELRDRSRSKKVIYVGRYVPALDKLGILDEVFEWLPLHSILDRARLVVTQGGTGSSYQALEYGKPVATLPGHRNHEILGEIVQARNVGILCGHSAAHTVPSGIDFESLNYEAATLGVEMRSQICGAEIAAHEISKLL